MKKSIILRLIGSTVLVIGLSVSMVHIATNAFATASGTAGVGDECNVHAEDASHICEQGLVCVPKNNHSEGNGKCVATITPTPTQEPTITPTPTVTCGEDEDCITTTPTPTPTEEPTVTPEPQQSSGGNGGGTPNVGSPTCTAGDFPRPFALQFVSATADTATFKWVKSADGGVDHQVAYVGLEEGKPVGSQIIPADQQTITFNYLPHGHAWADIVAIKGDCSEETGWVDPVILGH